MILAYVHTRLCRGLRVFGVIESSIESSVSMEEVAEVRSFSSRARIESKGEHRNTECCRTDWLAPTGNIECVAAAVYHNTATPCPPCPPCQQASASPQPLDFSLRHR
mgnify:CR=1 FL=1